MRVTLTLAAFLIVLATLPTPVRAQQVFDRIPVDVRPVSEEQRVPASSPSVDVEVAPEPTDPGGHDVRVGAIALTGLEALQPADFAEIIEPRLGQPLDDAALRALTGAIAQQARARGFAFASAAVEPQLLSLGVLKVRVDEGRIDEIRLEGEDLDSVRAALAPLTNGAPARLAEVERRLLIAQDIDGVHIRNSRYIREHGRGVLVVEVETDPVSARATLSNQGTRPVGPTQLRIDADINGLLASDDSLSLSYTVTPLQPRGLHYGYARYTKRIDASGTEVAVSGSASEARPGAYLRDLRIRSRSWYAAAHVLQPLLRRRSTSLWFEGELSLRSLLQWQEEALVRRDRLAVARGTLYGYTKAGSGWLRAGVTVSQGLGVLDATRAGDLQASRTDADGTFTSAYGWADWTGAIGSDFSLRLAAQGQVSSAPLLVTEETGLGGTAFLRGYDWSERSGDHGAMGTAELRYDWKNAFDAIPSIQFYGFVDGGTVGNRKGGYGGGSLASAGSGLRMDLGAKLWADLGAAVPLSGPAYDRGDASPRLHVLVSKAF